MIRMGHPTTECQNCRKKDGSELCDLDGTEAAAFEGMRRTILYEPGQYVFYEGHSTLGLYVLCSGRVKLTRSTARGHQRLVAIVDPGMMIERHTFQDGAVHEVTCQALEPSQLCVIDRDQYLALLSRRGGLAVNVIKLLSRQMRVTLEEVDQVAFLSARERLARLLLELARRYGEPRPNGCTIMLTLKREELAQMAALTLETTVRLLKSFQGSEIVQLKGREITILRPDQLQTIARSRVPSSAPP